MRKPRKPKTPLLAFLQRTFDYALLCEGKGEEFAEQLIEKRAISSYSSYSSYSRRQFLTDSLGTAALGGLVLASAREIKASSTQPNIAIVGGGIAGLNAAYQLHKRGLRAIVYEAASPDKPWGRIQTQKMGNGIGLTRELGGEFIDSGHKDMLQLAREFRLPLIDTLRDVVANKLKKDSYFFGGKHYTEREVIREFRSITKRIAADANSLPDEISYKSKDPNLKRIDKISIEEYLKGLGVKGWLYELLEVAYTSEYGLNIGEQSAINFVNMIDTGLASGFEIFGESDERYKIKGGNNQIIEALKRRLRGQIEPGKKLEAVQSESGKHILSFSDRKEVRADIVIFALPFSTLRDVDLKKVALTEVKKKAINELGYGTGAKLLISVNSRVWREQKCAGYLFSEKVHNGWDNSQGQNNNRGAGGYTVFLGGDDGKNLKKEKSDIYLNELDAAFKGFKSSQTDVQVINWTNAELNKGSYACYKVGQVTEFAGAEFEPGGGLYFCGEHCSLDFQGYMNGGAETGRRVALAILQRLNRKR
jgi:monoamine oxidase